MIINYKRGDFNLMIDIDKIDFISSKSVNDKWHEQYDVAIGFNSGLEINFRLDYCGKADLLNILGDFIRSRKDYITAAANPLLDKEIFDMDVSNRVIKACESLGVKTLGDLSKQNRQEVLAINRIGEKTINELDELLEHHMLWWDKQ